MTGPGGPAAGPEDGSPVTVLRVHKAGWPPQRFAFYLCPAQLAARLAADAAALSADQVADSGPVFLLCQPAARHEAGVPRGGDDADGARRGGGRRPVGPVGGPGAGRARARHARRRCGAELTPGAGRTLAVVPLDRPPQPGAPGKNFFRVPAAADRPPP